MSPKTRMAMDEAIEADDLLDVFQIACGLFELGDGIDGAEAGCLKALSLIEVAPEFAGEGELAVEPGQLTRGINQIAGADPGDVCANALRRGWQRYSKAGEIGFSGHVNFLNSGFV